MPSGLGMEAFVFGSFSRDDVLLKLSVSDSKWKTEQRGKIVVEWVRGGVGLQFGVDVGRGVVAGVGRGGSKSKDCFVILVDYCYCLSYIMV